MDKDKGRFLHTHPNMERNNMDTDHVVVHREHWERAIMALGALPSSELPARFMHDHPSLQRSLIAEFADTIRTEDAGEEEYRVIDRRHQEMALSKMAKLVREVREEKKRAKQDRKKNPPKSRYQILQEQTK